MCTTDYFSGMVCFQVEGHLLFCNLERQAQVRSIMSGVIFIWLLFGFRKNQGPCLSLFSFRFNRMILNFMLSYINAEANVIAAKINE